MIVEPMLNNSTSWTNAELYVIKHIPKMHAIKTAQLEKRIIFFEKLLIEFRVLKILSIITNPFDITFLSLVKFDWVYYSIR